MSQKIEKQKIERGDVLVQQHIATYDRCLVLNPEADEDGWIHVFDLDDLIENGIKPKNLDRYENLGPISALIP